MVAQFGQLRALTEAQRLGMCTRPQTILSQRRVDRAGWLCIQSRLMGHATVRQVADAHAATDPAIGIIAIAQPVDFARRTTCPRRPGRRCTRSKACRSMTRVIAHSRRFLKNLLHAPRKFP